MTRSRSSSVVSLSELKGDVEDKSLERAGDLIRLTKCEDADIISIAYKYCSKCLAGAWAKCKPEKFTVNILNGGLTNYLYVCEVVDDVHFKPHEPRKVLLRIYGDIVDQKQRFYEGVIFTLLSERGIGPKTFGVFNSGRIEEFIPFRDLFTTELADPMISTLIAKRLAEFHSINLPLSKEPTFLWENMEKFIEVCSEITFEEETKQERFEKMKKKINVHLEYKWLRKMLTDLNSPVVFSHNDLQEGNILYINTGDVNTDVKIVDYDYSSFNYRGYDIGNHFCEWMYEYKSHHENGFKVFYNAYPSRSQQELFAQQYIKTTNEILNSFSENKIDHQKFKYDLTPCSVETLLDEGNKFALASHFFWLLWSVIQARLSKICFGYLEYAEIRLEAYITHKKQIGF